MLLDTLTKKSYQFNDEAIIAACFSDQGVPGFKFRELDFPKERVR
jgi:hypothetical protein